MLEIQLIFQFWLFQLSSKNKILKDCLNVYLCIFNVYSNGGLLLVRGITLGGKLGLHYKPHVFNNNMYLVILFIKVY